ncbi:Translocator protein -like protein [Escovopsis weberi]|uniref:Translocator protein-like protein n=1 Tax=Escovopsis weberi TaxID=150374 RepID=A0A0M8MTT0_ESCWE|nr:Translocator protein -like protein [Escovopsis weberi]
MTTHIPALTLPLAIFQSPATSILFPVALGVAVGASSRPSNPQKTYQELKQPPLRPPPWVFGPVWTTLYGVMGYAAYRAANAGLSPLASPQAAQTTRHSLTLYTVQLGLNFAWMPIFFLAKRPVAASVDIVCLLGANAYLAYLWSSVDGIAAWCQAPYVAWLSFATYLCIGTGYLNGWDLSRKGGHKREKEE